MEIQVGKGIFRVRVNSWQGALSVSVEGSVATMVHGDNLNGLDVRDLRDVVQELQTFISAEVPGCPRDLRRWGYVRIDATREFEGVCDPQKTLELLAALAPGNRLHQHVHSGSDGGIESVTREARGRWRATCYDKGREMAAHARRVRDPAHRAHLRSLSDEVVDRIRYEVQLHDRYLREHPISITAADTPSVLQERARYHFDRAGFGRVLTGRPRHAIDGIKKIQQEQGDAGARKAIVELVTRQYPELGKLLGETAASPTRRRIRELGLQPADLFRQDGGEGRWLDFDRGHELPAPTDGIGEG